MSGKRYPPDRAVRCPGDGGVSGRLRDLRSGGPEDIRLTVPVALRRLPDIGAKMSFRWLKKLAV